MRRDLHRGLLGGIEAALAWAIDAQVLRGGAAIRRSRELALSLARWEDEGGGLAARTAIVGPRVYSRVVTGVPSLPG